jgi:succinoglycan biosynthesis protein ExoO
LPDPPRVTVAIAAFNAAAFLEEAVHCALGQEGVTVEVVIVDDCSSDNTMQLLERMARDEPRIRIESLPENQGPAAARNRALSVARGEWFAVLDSDDLFASDRLSGLVEVAELRGAHIIADNPVLFDESEPSDAKRFLGAAEPGWILLDSYLAETELFARGRDYGYLKPVFRTAALNRVGLAYNERLRIAEDDDLIVRALLAGLNYWFEPTPGYGYRRHDSSTSHRLSVANASSMAVVGRELANRFARHSATTALKRRAAAFDRARSFVRLVDALKQRDARRALAIAAGSPQMLSLLRMPVQAALRRSIPGLRHRPLPADETAIAALQAMIGVRI